MHETGEKKFEKNNGYTIEEIMNFLNLKQNEGKNLKKSLLKKEKNKQEKKLFYTDKKEDPKEKSKNKHMEGGWGVIFLQHLTKDLRKTLYLSHKKNKFLSLELFTHNHFMPYNI